MRKERSKLSGTVKTAIICAILFLILLIGALMVNIVRQGELSARARALETEISRLEREKAESSELLAELNSEDAADAYAREQLDLKKKGEELYKGEEQ